ncbi:MAG: hypothetical protein RSE12_16955 [Fuscovulum sp.]|nr:MAG: hypothetical protein RSE12_16955 [Fuscovulum sp.]
MVKSFSADLRKFKGLTVEKMEKVVRASVQDVLEGAQTTATGITKGGTLKVGNIPVAEGELAGSLTSSVAGGGESVGEASYIVAIEGYKLGAPMQFAWPMVYAMRIENGFVGTDALGREYNQPGWHFVGINAAKWEEHVAKNAANLA